MLRGMSSTLDSNLPLVNYHLPFFIESFQSKMRNEQSTMSNESFLEVLLTPTPLPRWGAQTKTHHPWSREGVKKFRRVGGPGLQHDGKPFEIIVGRVTSRGVFQFLHTLRPIGHNLSPP
jgi:hypothetical protein